MRSSKIEQESKDRPVKHVFISRELRPDSEFRRLLSQQGWQLTDRSLVGFTGRTFEAPPAADWVFCYSSRAVIYFLSGLSLLGISPDLYPRYAAMGEGTARTLVQYGIEPAFVGSGFPQATARDFLEQARDCQVLFPRAQQSRRSVQQLLYDELVVHDLIVYKNEIRLDLPVPYTPFVVLTSPLNAKAYRLLRLPSSEQYFIAIGATTAKALKKLAYPAYTVADRADETALARAVLALSEGSNPSI